MYPYAETLKAGPKDNSIYYLHLQYDITECADINKNHSNVLCQLFENLGHHTTTL